MGGPCPLGDSWVYNREEEEWTKLEDCSSPVNDGAMISVGTLTVIIVNPLSGKVSLFSGLNCTACPLS